MDNLADPAKTKPILPAPTRLPALKAKRRSPGRANMDSQTRDPHLVLNIGI